MTAKAHETFPGRVNDALRQLQATLLGAIETPEIAGDLFRDALDMARRLREEIVEPEIAKTPTDDKPIGLALSVYEAEAHRAILSALGAGSTILVAPTDVQREALAIVALRLRSQIDQHAARVQAAPPAPPTPPSPAEASL